MKVYDLIILGAGPAGITASVYAARKKMDFLVLSLDIGGQTALSGDIENYTGYQFITGPELTLKFEEHMKAFSAPLNMPEAARDIQKEKDLIKVITDKNEYISKTIIVATGKRPRMLDVPGEKEFKNKGVTYCATCDGPLFKGKKVAVIGGGNSALDATLQLMKISPKVYMINIAQSLTGDPIMIESVKKSANVEIFNSSKVKEITGDKFVKSIAIEKEGKAHNLDVEGIFIEIGLIPNSEFDKITKHNEYGEVIVDCHNSTNIEGIFAAGDVTTVPEKQIVIACGEGSKATLSAFRYLSTHRFNS
ncbi:MAG: FAD-dependent oxidoreductase [Candidatus Omnitrophica bacterium]|nr:FAD-dependent oxidoreductase [Candidatus Omnitrophota bacterium]